MKWSMEWNPHSWENDGYRTLIFYWARKEWDSQHSRNTSVFPLCQLHWDCIQASETEQREENISCWATPFSPFLFVPPRRKTMLCLLYLLKSDSAFQRESFRCWNAGTASRKINSLSLYCTFSGNVDTCSVFLSPPFSFFLSDYLLRCRPLFPIDRRLSFKK